MLSMNENSWVVGLESLDPALREICAREVHVWRISLTQPENTLQDCRRLLSAEESDRADSFHFRKHYKEFVIAHGALRTILASYLDAQPQHLRFTHGSHGKPDLSKDSNPIELTFNLSHSGDLALLAVGLGMHLGVDVEVVRSDLGGQEIAERYFSDPEVKKLLALAPGNRADAFFQCWTRKEAYIKARGEGLSIPLDSFDVAFVPGEKPALLNVRTDPTEVLRWSLYDLRPAHGYKAALVALGVGHDLKYWDWRQGPR
jgi:4'-phosphopantetheinyl transferase